MIKKDYLLSPGPTPLPQSVLSIAAEPIIHHRTPEFSAIYQEVTDGLKYVFQTQNDIFILASSGTGAMEAAVVNTLSPGERIISCAAGKKLEKEHGTGAVGSGEDHVDADGFIRQYTEDSGTSMAAPHVSGVIAAFLSIRREFIGRPEQVKEIFISNATDLKREAYMQGQGLVDLMRSIQAV